MRTEILILFGLSALNSLNMLFHLYGHIRETRRR